jgi:hypothetical protein
MRDEHVERGGVGGDAGQVLGGRGGMGAARDGPGDGADRRAALLDGDFDAVGALRGVDDPALAAVAEREVPGTRIVTWPPLTVAVSPLLPVKSFRTVPLGRRRRGSW